MAASALLAAGCTVPASQSADGGQDSGPKVVASFYPLQWLTQEIAGDGVAVGSLTPKGAEPHDSELELSQVSALGEADLLVTLGGFQAAVDQAAESNPPAEVLDVGPSVGIEGSDPHFWLDPAKLGLAAAPIGEALAKADPDGAEGYLDRAKAAADQLEILDAQLATALRPFEGAYLVTTHAAFNYFGQRYHLEQIAIVGIDPEAEPTPARLAEVRDQIGGLPVATIFFEEPASSKVAETLAAELGVKTARLNPVETDSGGDYITAMRDNLGALEQGLVRP
ncbi:MAG: metal ABC transporter substrate-binding protein [Bifidobacteriaceae bacterium]|nr:metal ABC transporter substrate-binding protein [Bifidobacteriaceae bacterium]